MRKEEGELKDACKKLFEANGFYYRSLSIGVIPGRKNQSKGMPDAIVCKNGFVAWLEMKSKNGKLSEEQETFIFQWTAHGGNVFVVRSLDDALKIIQKSRVKEVQNPPMECTRCRLIPPSV